MNQRRIVTFLTCLVLALTALNCIFAFGDAGSTAFVQVFMAATVVALTVVAIKLFNGSQPAMPVMGAGMLYFGSLLARAPFYLLDSFVNMVREISLNNMQNAYQYGDLSAEKLTELQKKAQALTERTAKDTLGEIVDVICVILAVAFAAFALFTLVQLLCRKKFCATPLGKLTLAVFNVKCKCHEHDDDHDHDCDHDEDDEDHDCDHDDHDCDHDDHEEEHEERDHDEEEHDCDHDKEDHED